MRLPALKSSKRLHGRPWFWRLRRNVKRWVRHGFRPPAKPVKVFCVGWLKTATTSTGRALEVLGYRHLSYQLDLRERVKAGNLRGILAITRRYDSFDDRPWNDVRVIEQVIAAYPNAKFILTTREEQAWLNSFNRYFYFADEFTDTELLQQFRAHNADVRALLAERGCDWIELDVARDLDWPKLCTFLNLPIPDLPFPRVNTQQQHAATRG